MSKFTFSCRPKAYKKVYFDIIKLEMYKIVLHNLIILNSFSSEIRASLLRAFNAAKRQTAGVERLCVCVCVC